MSTVLTRRGFNFATNDLDTRYVCVANTGVMVKSSGKGRRSGYVENKNMMEQNVGRLNLMVTATKHREMILVAYESGTAVQKRILLSHFNVKSVNRVRKRYK